MELSALPAAAALAGLPSAAYVLILNAIDRYEKEPWRLVLASVVLGAVVAPLLSMAVLFLLGHGFALPLGYAPGAAPDPVARIVEQVVVGGLLLGLIGTVRHEFDDTLDGIVYGAAIGAGLGAAETFAYAIGGTDGLEPSTIALLLASGLNQAFYGAVIGAIAGTSSHWADRRKAWLFIGLGVATSAFLSAFHDTLPSMLARLVERPDAGTGFLTRAIAFGVNILGIILLAGLVVSAWRRESRILHTYLAPEAAAGVCTPDEIRTLTSVRARLAREAAAFRRQRLAGFRNTRRLDEALGELAFHNWRTKIRRQPPPGEVGVALRARIRALRQALAAGTDRQEAS